MSLKILNQSFVCEIPDWTLLCTELNPPSTQNFIRSNNRQGIYHVSKQEKWYAIG